jgi:uncharacterized membrane protein
MEKDNMKRSIWLAVAIFGAIIFLALLVGLSLLGNWNNGGWGMMNGWSSGSMHGLGFGYFGWFGVLLMLLIPIGFVILVVLGIAGLIRGISSTGEVSPIFNQREEAQNSPRDILQIRYGGGEITREQYLQMLDDLS